MTLPKGQIAIPNPRRQVAGPVKERFPGLSHTAPENLRTFVPMHPGQVQHKLYYDYALVKESALAALTPYQEAGLEQLLRRRDGLFYWVVGCVAADTTVLINRGGATKPQTVEHVWAQLNSRAARPWDLSIPTFTQSVTEEGYARLNRIVAAADSGVKVTYLLKTATGEQIRATADHRFATPHGWACLKDLQVGDVVYGLAYPKQGQRSPKRYYRQVPHMWHHPAAHLDYRNGKKRTAMVAEHRLVVEADLNGLSFEAFVGRLALGRVEGLLFLPRDILVHHKNEDTQDNRLANLERMSVEEHARHHADWRAVTARQVERKVTFIGDCRAEPTYDLCMAAPNHNFVANGLVVHNSGKSLGALVWGLAPQGKKLVYCTRGSARLQVVSEIEKWTTASYQLLTGEQPTKRACMVPGKRKALVKGFTQVPDEEVLDNDAQIYIVTYEVLPAWIPFLDQYLTSGSFSLVLDECQHVKAWKRVGPADPPYGWRTTVGTPSSEVEPNRAWAVKRLSLRALRRLAVTGTPIRDRPRDLWAELDLVDPGGFGSNWQFTERYCDRKETAWGGYDTTGSSNEEELRTRVDTLVHRVGHAEVAAQIPPKRRSVVRVPESDLEELKGPLAELARDARKSKLIAVQVGLVGARKAGAVVDVVESLFEENPYAKVTVFTWLRADCERLAERCHHALPTLRLLTAHGGTAPDERAEMRNLYMDNPGPSLLIGTGDAWGEAVNLQDTDHAIFASLPFTPGQIEQWEGRFSRKGQLRPVTITYLVAENTADEHIASMLLEKLPVLETVVDLGGVAGVSGHLRDALGFNDADATERLMDLIGAGESVE